MNLQSIAKEAAACRAAWAAMPDATAGVHIHHEAPAEALTEPIERRIEYILSTKPKKEQALRLRLMRPITASALAEYEKATASALAEYETAKASAWAEYEKATASAWAEYETAEASALAEYKKAKAPAHRAICPTPDCPWDGRSIFGGHHD